MEYLVITLLAISFTAFIVYLLANKLFKISLSLKSLLLCAACALILCIGLPRLVVSFVGLAGTIVFLALFAVIFAYIVAYYDNPNFEKKTDNDSFELDLSPDTAPHTGLAGTRETEISDATFTHRDDGPLVTIEYSLSNSLDDLLDFAFQHKETGNNQLALDTFRQAYNLYHESDAAPHLALEISKLLMNKGAYDEAISFLTISRNLPGLARNSLLERELISTIAYLRIIKNTLIQRRTGYLPFNQIPVDISEEINVEFREWRILA
ncbi:MAG: hypothetical protein H6Q74_950 [Firmicutes bacterium]|nr:hypothetical protein [Bacillota bacterium]